VLRDYGNMSSPTVMFVLERTIAAKPRGRHLMAAFGPGFTVSFALLDLSPA
jgi:alkylresorcinol/alkylpyrone synthase